MMGASLPLACVERGLAETDTDAPAASTDAPATSAGSSSTGAPDPTTGAPDPTTGAPTTADASSSGSEDSSSWVPDPDLGSGSAACDVWSQNCPEGQKCAPVAKDMHLFGDVKCVPLAPDPAQEGEPCESLGNAGEGLDTCAEGTLCMSFDPDTGIGHCVAQCIGSPDAPACPSPASKCVQYGSGFLTSCFPECDPLASDCMDGDVCVPFIAEGAEHFLCLNDASHEEGQAFDPCPADNSCDPGLYCGEPEFAAECDPQQDGCCVPFCDVTIQPDACPGAGQECVSWYEGGPIPPGKENIGVCIVP